MASPAPSELAARAAAAQPAVAALALDDRLARRPVAGGPGGRRAAVVDQAVAEVGQPRRFARRELESALGLLDALPALAEAIRPRPVPATSGSTLLEWAPYGVVLGWHAANSPVWVPTVVTASALAAGNAVLARPSARARRTGALVLEALGAAWPADAIVRVDLPGPEAEPLVWDPNVHAVVAHASTATCKRQLAAWGRPTRRARACAPTSPRARATTR